MLKRIAIALLVVALAASPHKHPKPKTTPEPMGCDAFGYNLIAKNGVLIYIQWAPSCLNPPQQLVDFAIMRAKDAHLDVGPYLQSEAYRRYVQN